MQGVQSDHRAADVDLLQQGPDGRNLAPLFGVGVAGDGHRVVVANQRHGFVMGVSLTIGGPVTQTFAVGRQSGGGRLPARHPTLKDRLKPLGVGVDHRSMQGGPRGRVVATGPGISPSAEAAQFLLVQSAGKTPSGIDSPVTGQPSQRPEGRQSGQLELAALGSTVIRDALELLQQRGKGLRWGAHRRRPLRLPGGARLGIAQPLPRSGAQGIDAPSS